MKRWKKFNGVTGMVTRPWLLATLLVVAVLSTWPSLALRPSLSHQAIVLLLGLSVYWGLRQAQTHPSYPYLAVMLLAATLGHFGLVLGLMLDFGPAGLLMLASWCSGQGGLGPGDAGRMVAAAPWGHLGMLLGCNLGMIAASCGRLPAFQGVLTKPAFLSLCNVGMLAGMLVFALLFPLAPGHGLSALALLMLGQMTCGMVFGMIGVWLLVQRLGEIRTSVPVFASKVKR